MRVGSATVAVATSYGRGKRGRLTRWRLIQTKRKNAVGYAPPRVESRRERVERGVRAIRSRARTISGWIRRRLGPQRPEIRAEASGTLRTHQCQRDTRQRQRSLHHQVAVFEGRSELALPAEQSFEVVETR